MVDYSKISLKIKLLFLKIIYSHDTRVDVSSTINQINIKKFNLLFNISIILF